MSTRTRDLIGTVTLLGLVAWGAGAQTALPRAAKAPAVATVGPLEISRDDFERRAAQSVADYRARAGSEIPAELRPLARRQLLEGLIRFELMVLETRRTGAAASLGEAEQVIQRDPFFNPGGHFDPQKFAAVKASGSPAFQSAIQELRERIGAQHLTERIERESAPPDSILRAKGERALAQVTLDYLLLPGRDFGGHDPEPRETAIVTEYREHAADFRRPDRAVLSIVFLDQPALPESLRAHADAARAWEARLRQSADSAIAAVRGGASLNTVAATYGGVRRGVVVTRDNFPAYWQGGAASKAAPFAASPGTVLPEPIPARPGWMLVRVDQVQPAHLAPLAEVAREIRSRLRREAALHREERELRPIYEALRDSLRGPAVRVRYALVDSSRIDPGEPDASELDRYYRGHLADYSLYDQASGSIRARPLAEVRGDLLLRWKRDRRVLMSRAVVDGLQRAWSHGARDRELERRAVLMRDLGPVPVGAPVDTGAAGGMVTDSLVQHAGKLGVGVGVLAGGGVVVYHAYERVENLAPTFEQARTRLRARAAERRAAADEAEARALYQRDPAAFARGNIVVLSRLAIQRPDPIRVPLTRREVIEYRDKHLDQYSAPEQVSARHILISPTGPGEAADRVARARADSILERIREGEDFASIASRVSDDPATQGKGGDLGVFGRGVMLDEVEHAVFAMQPGDVSEPVKSSVGYHLIKCTAHQAPYMRPLEWTYGNIAYDAAVVKGDTIAAHRADSLFRTLRSPAQARAIAQRLRLPVLTARHAIGEEAPLPELAPYLKRIERMKPGELYPGVIYEPRAGFVISWVDSILPPETPTWESARERALDLYRSGASGRAIRAKCSELDSMMSSGWSLDSLAALWGGLRHEAGVVPRSGIRELGGGGTTLDSLIYGELGGRPLGRGEVSDWIRFRSGLARIRMGDKLPPNPGQLAAQIQNDRRIAVERAMRTYFNGLKRRYPVRILDARLRNAELPPLPGDTP